MVVALLGGYTTSGSHGVKALTTPSTQTTTAVTHKPTEATEGSCRISRVRWLVRLTQVGNLSAHQSQLPVPHSQVCEQSCAALCVLALRKPENSRVIVEGGGALAALQAMKAHPQEAGVQVSKQVCPPQPDLQGFFPSLYLSMLSYMWWL